MRGRLGAIQAAAPTVFRYCCARGIQNPPAAPTKKLQPFETLRLLWKRVIVCSKNNPNLTHLCGAPDRVVGPVAGYLQRRGCDTFQEVGPNSLPSRPSRLPVLLAGEEGPDARRAGRRPLDPGLPGAAG